MSRNTAGPPPAADGASPSDVVWQVVIPQKDLRVAKSRIHLIDTSRRRLVRAMLADTVDAVRAVTGVERVIVVCDNGADADELANLDATLHVDRLGRGLNAAVESGAVVARAVRPSCAVAVLPGDLPGLRPGDLARALRLARAHARSFVADAAGAGTTMLAAMAGRPLAAAYGRSSRAAHTRSGAVEVGGRAQLDSLRRDVDDLASLAAVVGHGCGERTRRVYAELSPVDIL